MSPVLKIVVVREDDLADYLAGKTDAPPVVALDGAENVPVETAQADVEPAAETAAE
jgi:hypothetical protein